MRITPWSPGEVDAEVLGLDGSVGNISAEVEEVAEGDDGNAVFL